MQPQQIADVTTNSMDDEIVISGFSGRFPKSSNIEEFKQQLFEGVDLVTDDEFNLYGVPSKAGKLKDLGLFDATFFKIQPEEANVLDPQLRMLLEITYEAIIDAGVNPVEVRGSKTSVFVHINGSGLTGSYRAMFANRLSHLFGFKGPSFALDSANSSSLHAMHNAIEAMQNGQCDAAIVGGVNFLVNSENSLQFDSPNMLLPEFVCRSFDSSAKGYALSESAVVIYLKKSCNAKRVYATVVNSKVNSNINRRQRVTSSSGSLQYNLMHELYEEAEINPVDISYVEAYGIGIKDTDAQEVNAIANLFCTKDRKSPLLIGSVKSNMGHSEASSGLCSVVKVLLAMEQGVIPRNLHFKSPNTDIPALLDGRIKVVTENTSWEGGLVGVNSFGFGGINGHVLLRSNRKSKAVCADYNVPKLVMDSGRTDEAVHSLLDAVKNHKHDDELIGLIHSIHSQNIPGHSYRGYYICNDNNDREVEAYNNEKRPVWFVFFGMGAQWPGMGKELMCLPIFYNSLRRCAEVLKPLGIDLMDVILNSTEKTFDDILNCYVSIAAIEIALVDLLTVLDIKPDGMIGHSFGEIMCAYADGCFTAEQTVLAAYWRGKSLKETKLPENMGMAATGLSWEEAKRRCPEGVFPACHNAVDSVSIAGPKPLVEKFVTELQAEKIFTKVVNTLGFAFHSKYIADAGPNLRANFEKMILNPKQRSSRWISTSVPESAWNTPLAQFNSTEYHVNNFLGPVLFQQGLSHIPSNAIIIEISPNCLLQAVLKRSLPTTISVGLHKKNHPSNIEFFLTNIGKLYNAGLQPQINKIYPPISYPVGRGTPMINSLVKWDHSIQLKVAYFSGKSSKSTKELDL